MLSKKKKEEYISGWQKREKKKKKELKLKEKEAWQKAKKAADFLKENYGVEKVILFGSLATGHFREQSDIDLAVKGLSMDKYLEIARKTSKVTSPYKVELIPLEEASPSLKKRINLEGVDIQ